MDLIGNRSSAGAEEREFSGLLLGLYTTAVAISFRGEDEWGGPSLRPFTPGACGAREH